MTPAVLFRKRSKMKQQAGLFRPAYAKLRGGWDSIKET